MRHQLLRISLVQSAVLENEAFRTFSGFMEPPCTDLLTTQEVPQIAAQETPEQFRRRISQALDRLAAR